MLSEYVNTGITSKDDTMVTALLRLGCFCVNVLTRSGGESKSDDASREVHVFNMDADNCLHLGNEPTIMCDVASKVRAKHNIFFF